MIQLEINKINKAIDDTYSDIFPEEYGNVRTTEDIYKIREDLQNKKNKLENKLAHTITIMKRKVIIDYIPEDLNITDLIDKITKVTYHISGDVKIHIFNDLCDEVTPVYSIWLIDEPGLLLKNEKFNSILVDDVNILKQDSEKYKIWYHNIMTFIIKKDYKNFI